MSYQLAGGVTESNAEYTKKLAEAANKNKDGKYPPTIFIGLGGTGAKALLHLRHRLYERYNTSVLPATAFLSIDTDTTSDKPGAEDKDMVNSPLAETISFQESERINIKAPIKNIMDNLDDYPHVREWWDGNTKVSDEFNIEAGAGQIRPLSKMVVSQCSEIIMGRLESINNQIRSSGIESTRVNKEEKTNVYIIAGLAGGTGSGCFLDVAAMVKTKLNNRCVVKGYFVLPDAYVGAEGGDAYEKISANGASALREINHYLTNRYVADWGRGLKTPEEGLRGLFEQNYFFSGVNDIGEVLNKTEDAYRAIGEALFVRYSGGGLPGFIDSVRINREQYLQQSVVFNYKIKDADGNSKETHAAEWKTALSAFGISKIVYPSWRLLHYARYDLGVRLLDLMDPSAGQSTAAVVGKWRDRFLIDWGIFQGTYEDSENPEAYNRKNTYMVRDAMLKLPGQKQGNIISAIDNLAAMLVQNSEGMFEERSTGAMGTKFFEDMRKKLGDPKVAKSAGEWSEQIIKNRKLSQEQLRENLDTVIEKFYQDYGLSATKEIIEQCIHQLNKDEDAAHYKKFMEAQERIQEQNAIPCLTNWHNQLNVAVESEKGIVGNFGRNSEVHNTAVTTLADYFKRYWGCKFKSNAAYEGAKLYDFAIRKLEERLNDIENTIEIMRGLSNRFKGYKMHFSSPMQTTMFQELPVLEDLNGLLKPYLGETADAQRSTLKNYLQKVLRQLGLTTLRSLQTQLNTKLAVFRIELEARLFDALKGNDGGGGLHFTSAFDFSDTELSDDENRGVEGFIDRHSIMNKLSDGSMMQTLEDMVKNLYRQGRPWVDKGEGMPGAIGDKYRIYTDAFLGIRNVKGKEATFGRLEKLINTEGRNKGENPRIISISDPSEIILYVETHAFPIFHISGLYNNGFHYHYEKLLYDENKREALHLHKDYHEFAAVVPYTPEEQRKRQDVLKQFILGQILNRIQTIRQNTSHNDGRHAYQWTRKVDNQDIQQLISVEAIVLYTFSKDTIKLNEMKLELQMAIETFLKYGGKYADLYTLVDYWCHVLYPIILPESRGGVNAMPKGSMHNLVLDELRVEFKIKSEKRSEFRQYPQQLHSYVQGKVRSLTDWTRPVAYEKMKCPLPIRYIESSQMVLRPWRYTGGADLTTLSKSHSSYYFDHGWLNRLKYDTRDGLMPFIGLNWKKFSPQRYDVVLNRGREEYGLTKDDLIELLQSYISSGDTSKSDLKDVEVQAAAHKEDGTLDSFQQLLAHDEIRDGLIAAGLVAKGRTPSSAKTSRPPLPGAPSTSQTHTYACGSEVKEGQSVQEIRTSMSQNPNLAHYILVDGKWADAAGALPKEHAGLPPLPGGPPSKEKTYVYAHNKAIHKGVTESFIQENISQFPNDKHRVLNHDRSGWDEAKSVFIPPLPELNDDLPPLD